jgi:hypothetical protein
MNPELFKIYRMFFPTTPPIVYAAENIKHDEENYWRAQLIILLSLRFDWVNDAKYNEILQNLIENKEKWIEDHWIVIHLRLNYGKNL